ncbi:MAG: BatA domain-containing protein, partial [Pseudomonadota bacterium]
MALTFLTPWVLLALASLPVIWWLLRALPPAPRRVPFGGMMFLNGLRDKKQTAQHTPWWLLLLRLLAMAFIIIGLAGPVLNTPEDELTEGPVLIILDDSWPAAPGWQLRQNAMSSLALRPQIQNRQTRILTMAGTPMLSPPTEFADAALMIEGMVPKASVANRTAALDLLSSLDLSSWNIIWLSDGVTEQSRDDQRFLNTVAAASSLKIIRPPARPFVTIREIETTATSLSAKVERMGAGEISATLCILGREGRTLETVPFTLPAGQDSLDVPIPLPLSLRNEISQISVQGVRSAGALWMFDHRNRQVQAGLVTAGADNLLEGGFFIDQSFKTSSLLRIGPLMNFISEDTGLIILDDIGTLRQNEEDALLAWVEEGGILLRFAGPNTANARAATGNVRGPTYPALSRGGERSFGGALTWTAPQTISPFPEDSPFADLPIEDDIFIRRQILAQPSSDRDHAVWAQLTDGTPLITAKDQGEGKLILVHVTAAPTWSDLPLSGLFPQMMNRITELAVGVATLDEAASYAPYRLLNGYGELISPPPAAEIATKKELMDGRVPPGLYGDRAQGIAVNTYPDTAASLQPLRLSALPPNAILRGTEDTNARAFGPLFLALAFLLLLLDGLVLAAQKWQAGRNAVATTMIALALVSMSWQGAIAQETRAQETLAPRPRLDPQAVDASLNVRLAYVKTRDPQTDRISKAGLYGLTREAIRRSSLEPSLPLGVDIERDELSVYPLLYWPILPDAPRPSDAALGRLEVYMAGGGL